MQYVFLSQTHVQHMVGFLGDFRIIRVKSHNLKIIFLWVLYFIIIYI